MTKLAATSSRPTRVVPARRLREEDWKKPQKGHRTRGPSAHGIFLRQCDISVLFGDVLTVDAVPESHPFAEEISILHRMRTTKFVNRPSRRDPAESYRVHYGKNRNGTAVCISRIASIVRCSAASMSVRTAWMLASRPVLTACMLTSRRVATLSTLWFRRSSIAVRCCFSS
jgi:hypothetical protein